MLTNAITTLFMSSLDRLALTGSPPAQCFWESFRGLRILRHTMTQKHHRTVSAPRIVFYHL